MSCLFNSFSALVGEPAQGIRAKICDWLVADPMLMEDLSASAVIAIEANGTPLDRYVAQMRAPSTWGGAIEIRAFVQMWKRPVKVWAIRSKRWIEFPCSEGQECRISWTGGHYEPMP